MKKHIPNILSGIRLVLALQIGIFSFFSPNMLLMQMLIVIAIFSDKLDGSLARFWNVESELGKKLESLVDPILACTAILYLLLHKNLPVWFIVYSGISFFLIFSIRLFISVRKKHLFYKKSPITRYSVGVLYVLILFYLFSIPYKEWFLALSTLIGTIAGLNYIRLLLQPENATAKKKTELTKKY